MSKTVYRGKTAAEMCGVELEYRNKDLEVVSHRECNLSDFSELLKNTAVRLISDVEDLAYRATDGKGKDEWPQDVMASFTKLRHKLLDMAGEIERLSKNLRVEVDVVYPSSPPVEPMRFRNAELNQSFSQPKWDFLRVLQEPLAKDKNPSERGGE